MGAGLDELLPEPALPEGAVLDHPQPPGPRRHRIDADLAAIFLHHYDEAAERVAITGEPPLEQRQLIGAYFTMEYAYASAAFFNPSIIADRDQSGVPAGSVRFVMSLRAVGEGHVSS
ncbi:MAG: hypothetical protein ACYTF8_16590, partial [Planctomycetota bacterium]